MSGKKLLIQKTIIPLDWNPNDPNGYNKWMKAIVQENRENADRMLNSPQLQTAAFVTPHPQFIGNIIANNIYPNMAGTNKVLQDAKEILYGGGQ
ncbi:hypothetical protein [Sphingobacterium psychroaquaticum]|uniref:hypothetical protein n=1 Tax=Sphingobacterium psychroaquaticum TaxID=561061 RepID=UPI001F0FCAAC|nr:hypothetical protein [Sphingobacterium psychroaquaticum]